MLVGMATELVVKVTLLVVTAADEVRSTGTTSLTDSLVDIGGMVIAVEVVPLDSDGYDDKVSSFIPVVMPAALFEVDTGVEGWEGTRSGTSVRLSPADTDVLVGC